MDRDVGDSFQLSHFMKQPRISIENLTHISFCVKYTNVLYNIDILVIS